MSGPTTLHELLEAECALAPEHDRAGQPVVGARPAGESGLASHLPMVLQALQALGADDAALQARWAARREPPAGPWPALAQREHALRARLDREGLAAVLAAELPQRMPHAGAVAFHALIRCAHALEAGHQGQLARALAYWSLRELPMPTASAHAPRPLAQWLPALCALPPPAGVSGRLISQRMQGWSGSPGFAALAPALALEDDTPWQLARWAAQAYADSGNFTLLHLVTGTRAFLVLEPWLPDAAARTAARRAFTVHAAAALRASGWQPGAADPQASDAAPLSALAAAAREPGRDDHAVKLVHAACWFEARDPDPLWPRAAARALRTEGVA